MIDMFSNMVDISAEAYHVINIYVCVMCIGIILGVFGIVVLLCVPFEKTHRKGLCIIGGSGVLIMVISVVFFILGDSGVYNEDISYIESMDSRISDIIQSDISQDEKIDYIESYLNTEKALGNIDYTRDGNAYTVTMDSPLSDYKFAIIEGE